MMAGREIGPRQRAALAVLVILAVAVGVLVRVVDGGGTASPAAWSPPEGPSGCTNVTILTGRQGAPYHLFGTELARRLQAAPEGWQLTVEDTNGSAENLAKLAEAPECRLALAQLSTSVDAVNGVDCFDPSHVPACGRGQAVPELRTLGPVHDDVIHMIIRAGDGIGPDDLCGRRVAVGPDGSGTQQITKVLLRVALGDCSPLESSGRPELVDRSPFGVDVLTALQRGRVDAVFWGGAAGTRTIVEQMDRNAQFEMVDLAEYRAGMQEDWDRFYRGVAEPFFPGAVYPADGLGPNDYPGIPYVETIVLPSALVAHEGTDEQLVLRAVAEIFRDPDGYLRALWGDNPAGRTLPDELSVFESPLYCFVRLHDVATEYYEQAVGRVPACGERSPRGS